MAIPDSTLMQLLRDAAPEQVAKLYQSYQSSPSKPKKPQKPSKSQIYEQMNEVQEIYQQIRVIQQKPYKPHKVRYIGEAIYQSYQSELRYSTDEDNQNNVQYELEEPLYSVELPTPEPADSVSAEGLADSQKLQQENLSLSYNIQKQLKTIKKLQAKQYNVQDMYSDLDRRYSQVVSYNQAMEGQIIRLIKELKLKDRMNTSSRDEINESLNQRNQVKAELARLQMQIYTYKDQAKSAIEEKDKLQSYMQSQQGQNRKERTYQQQIEQLRDENKHLKVDVYKAQKENIRLREGLKEVYLEVYLAKKRQEGVLASKCGAAKSELKSVEMKKSLLEKSAEVEDLKSEIKKLKGEKAAEKKKYEEQLFYYESYLAQKELEGEKE